MSLIMDIIVWPPRAVLSLLSSLFRLVLYICLFPFRIIANIGRSLWFKVCAVFQYSEHKLVLLKTCKPLCYIFTEGGAPDTIKSKEQAEEEEEESDKTVYQHRRSPSPAESDEGQSIASLIQDLVKLSQTETKPQDKVKGRVQQEKIQLLLQEIQELAAAGGITNSEDEVGEDVGVSGGGARVKVLLEDLGSLETYLNQFICEEDEETHPPPLPPERSGLLETIIEETASKESSPLHCRSPVPQRLKRLAPPTSHETISEEQELTHSQNEISQTLLLLQKVTQSQELKETLQQLSDMHKQSEGACQTPPISVVPVGSDEKATPTSDRERRESLKNQLDSSQLEMDSIISSLDQHQKFMSSQKELQEAMDSLNVHTTDEKSSSKATPPKSKPGPKSASSSKQATPPETEQIYDSLSAASPVYSNVVKKPRPPPPTHNPQESIYDSIKPVSVATVTDETPPPIPLRRTLSDVSTDSCENSPIFRRRRGSIGDEDRECCHGNHRRRHSNGKRHGRRHSSSTSSSNCRHCNHTQERSRSGDYYRGGSPSDDSQDDDDDDDDEVCVMSDRRRHESGYESHQDSPTLTRRVRGRHNSDGNWGPMTPPTPRDSKRGFFGLFSKKSTSLTSLNSTKSDVSERGSVSSYKL